MLLSPLLSHFIPSPIAGTRKSKTWGVPRQSRGISFHFKHGCLARRIFFNEQSQRYAISEYVAHCREERNHQGLDQRLTGVDEEAQVVKDILA